jgi:uncharacterized protein (UPF0264 family)
MADLLVSVRSAAEAETALAGGAALIDVKEPRNGPLGRAPDGVVAAVLRQVRGRRPVSAAFGELGEGLPPFHRPGLAFAKWGPAGLGGDPDWCGQLLRAAARCRQQSPRCRPVAVAYADWQAARAPAPAEVCEFACDSAWPVLLLDTWRKDGRTLLEWLPLGEVRRLARQCHQAGVRVALAGSLGASEIHRLGAAEPDWFAVRTAACRGGRRAGPIDRAAVRRLVSLLADPASAATSGGS